MKNTLQYAYSISVFLGVLLTAYLMMNKEGNARIPVRSFESAGFRSEALTVDPGVNQLFEMEDALSRLSPPTVEQKRAPSQLKFKR